MTRLVLKDAELRRQIRIAARIDEGVNPIGVCLHRHTKIVGQASRRLIYNPCESKNAMSFVLTESYVPENFREFAAHRTSQKVHLPKPITGGDIALCKIEIVIVRGFDVRNAAFVAPHHHAIAQALQLKTLRSHTRPYFLRQWRRRNRGHAYQKKKAERQKKIPKVFAHMIIFRQWLDVLYRHYGRTGQHSI